MKKIGKVLVLLFLATIFLTSCSCGEEKLYTITWKNYDGTVLEVDEGVKEGTVPTYDGAVPIKEGDENNAYTFSGWSPAVKKVTEDATYIAQFTARESKYTVTWKNHDGTVLEVDEDVPYDTMPEYNGATPTKEGHTFIGWEPALSKVKVNIEYIAKFKVSGGSGEPTSAEDFVFADVGEGYALVHYFGNASDVVIPGEYKGKPIISIQKWAFFANDTMKSLVIPDSVVDIKEDAFAQCKILERITFGSGLKTIGMMAFDSCLALEAVNLPEGFVHLDIMVFSNCPALTSVSLPNSIESFGEYMFDSYEEPSTVTYNEYANGRYLGNSDNPYLVLVDMIDKEATSFTIHNNCKLISDGALSKSNIETINFGSGVKIIGGNAFKNCKGLTELIIPEGIIKIGISAFSQSSVTKVTIAESVKYIGLYAFESCSQLTTVSLPNGLEFIGPYAFDYNDNLITTDYDGCNYLGNSDNPHLLLLEARDKSKNNIEIHKDTKMIADVAFYGCRYLTTITIPKNVKFLGKNLFYDSNNLTEVIVEEGNTVYEAPNNTVIIEKATKTVVLGLNNAVIPEGVTKIGDDAFNNCSQLETIIIPEGVTSIGDSAFSYCMKLESVTIPNSVTHIGRSAFSDCYKLASLTIPNKLKYIGHWAFHRCHSLTTLVVPDSVSYIDEYAFGNCEGLENLTLGSSLVVIGETAFSGCEVLQSITIPDSVKTIESSAFSGCSAVTSIKIGKGVISINPYAFLGCKGVATATVDSENKVYDSRENCNAIIETEPNILVFGTKATIIPDSVTEIGRYAFYECVNLENLELSDNITAIGEYAFYRCSGLNAIVIPESVVNVGRYAFRRCTNLKIFVETTELPETWDSNWNEGTPVYWYSEAPNYNGSHWHYVDGVPVIWVQQ